MEESDLWIQIFVFVFEGPEPQERVAVVDEEAEEILVQLGWPDLQQQD